jgi:hypothetical protein
VRVATTFEPATFTAASTRHAHALRCVVVGAGLAFILYQMLTSKYVNSLVDLYAAITGLCVTAAVIATARAMRIGITLDDNGVTVRTTFSTRNWPWSRIASARSLERVSRGGTLGLFAGPVKTSQQVQLLPMLTFTNGDTYRLYALRMTVRDAFDQTWVDEAMVEITRQAQERRAAATG